MRSHASLVVVVVLAAGCAGGDVPSASISATPSAIPSAAEAASPVPPSPTAIPTPAPTAAPTASPASTTAAACPSGSPLSVKEYARAWEAEWEEGVACFGSREVTVLGWVAPRPAIGFEPPGIRPSWLWFSGLALWDHPCDEEGGCTTFMDVHIPPDSGLEWGTDGRWVLITGHADDPRAVNCHYVYPSDWTGERWPDSQAQDTCRSSFVLTSVQDAIVP